MTGRYGMKAQGSWGNQEDVMLMVLDPEAWDNFNLSEEEQALKEKEEKDKENADNSDKSKDKKKSKKKDKKKSKDNIKDTEAESVDFDLDNRRYRMVRLTPMSSILGDYYLDKKGNKFYYVSVGSDGEANLMCRDLKKAT